MNEWMNVELNNARILWSRGLVSIWSVSRHYKVKVTDNKITGDGTNYFGSNQ